MLDLQVRSLPLGAMLNFTVNQSHTLYWSHVTAMFYAARRLLTTLQTDAQISKSNHLPIILRDHRRFPDVTSLALVNSSDRLSFRLTERIGGNGRLLYIGETTDSNPSSNKNILVKFSQQYSQDLHMFAAKEGFAPKLLACEKLPGGWFAAAMEYFDPVDHLDEPVIYNQRSLDEWLRDLDNIVDTLHLNGFVHGDLRVPNFVVHHKKLFLVDFDWGGKEGKAQFPDDDLLPILRDSRADVMITKGHDKHVLDVTKETMRNLQPQLMAS